jgi:large subunit ribosomal protein L24
MSKTLLRKGDQVQMIAGKDKGKQGKLLSIDADNGRAVVEGVNVVKRHRKVDARNPQGGIVSMEAPVHISNVAYLDAEMGKPTRLGVRTEKGKKVRFSKKSGKTLN